MTEPLSEFNLSSPLDAEESTVRQTIVASLEAPRLKGTTTKHFNLFTRERDLYEKKLAEKNREPGVNVPATTFKASIEDNMLRLFLAFGWIDQNDIADVTEDELKECIRTRASRVPKDNELGRVDAAVTGVKMDNKIPLIEDRVLNLVHVYLETLDAAGFQNLTEEKPHVAIRHIMKRLQPTSLYRRMRDVCEWKKNEQFDKVNFNRFIREVAAQAMRLDADADLSGRVNSGENSEFDPKGRAREQANSKRGGKGADRKVSKLSNWRPEKETSTAKRAGGDRNEKRKAPDCLNKACGGQHWISDCPNTSEDEKKRLVAEVRAKKKRAKPAMNNFAGTIKTVKALDAEDNTALFNATFFNGAVDCLALADQGADVNIVGSSVLTALTNANANFCVRNLPEPKVYTSVDENVRVTCRQHFMADIQLRIRHGTTLMLRGVDWLVSDINSEQVIIRRPLLDAIGCSNRDMLTAVCDHNNGMIVVPDLMRKIEPVSKPAGTVAALMDDQTGVFHSAGGDEHDGLNDEDVYIDIGEDEPGECEAELKKRVQEAIDDGLSEKGARQLEGMLQRYRSVFE